VVSGEADEVVERLVGFLKLGFTRFNFILAGQDKEEQVHRLANEVIPAVRATL
jgi:alkanesulfonate monooxygenase SsuD/methylene tetrahydromethanopterin reductase-like flavin-dependent oxidoreductase (luciferase family)